MSLGTSVDPVTIEQIHFYKSRFGEQPPTKKFRATPSVSEQFFGVTSNDASEEACELRKQHLKMEILAANYDKPMPPVYYLLKSKCSETECTFAETHELPKELKQDDPRLLPSYVTDIEATPPASMSSENVTLPQLSLASCENAPVITPAEQCESSKESCLPLELVTLTCENGTFDEENMFQPPIIYPVKVPSMPPLEDSGLEFYNNNVKVSINQCLEIEKATRSQSSSKLWFKQRQLRLTASNFGNIIKRKKADVSKLTNRLSTTCDSLHHLKAIRFGKENENVAAQLYVKYQNSHGSSGTKVFNCGLFINPQFPWLGASPDRLVYDPNATPSTGGLEVKCIESAQGMTPMEAYQMKRMPKEGKKKSFCLKIKNRSLQLDENHNYFYQVQGQEGVSGMEWFDFALLTDPHIGLNGLFVQRIYSQKTKWESEWLPKLTEFYFNHFLPVLLKDHSTL